MKRLLITGITGFVGSHLAEYLLGLGVEVHGLLRWRSPRDNILHIEDRLSLHEADLTDLPSLIRVLEDISPEYIFHLAAQSYVPYSYRAPIATLNTNVLGTTTLLEAVRTAEMLGVDPVVVVCSSSEVYGQVRREDLPIRETCPLRPVSPYGVSKVAEDLLGQMYHIAYGLRTVRARLFTHTGPRRGEVFAESSFARQIARIEAGLQESTVRHGNLDSMRCWLDVRDAVRAYWLLATNCPPGEVYNIAGDRQATVGEMLQHLISLSSRSEDIRAEQEHGLQRPSDVTWQIPDSSKFRSTTGWKPEIAFERTMKDLLDYWREQVGFRTYPRDPGPIRGGD